MNHFTLTTIAINALALIGVVTATGLAVLQDVPILPDVLIGAGAGTLVGKLLVYRLERLYGHELPARRVRQIESTWTAAGLLFGFAIGLLAALT